MKLFVLWAMLLSAAGLGFAAAPPVLFYSDLTSGPATGGEGGVHGAFVCVYGENFGAERGTSTIMFDDVEAAAYKLWSDPGPPYRAGHYAKACVQVSSKTTAGAVKVLMKTAVGRSNELSFVTVLAKVFFVASNGGDRTGDGSSEHPWQSIKRCKQAMSAGDICYVKSLTVSTHDNYGAVVWLDSSGLRDRPKALVAYPGAQVVVDGNRGASISRAVSNFRPGGTASNWTLAGLTFDAPNVAVQIYASEGIRFVDNDILCSGQRCFGADGGMVVGGPGAPSFRVTALGNRFHDIGCHDDPNYQFSAHPCAWLPGGLTTISTSGRNWTASAWTSSLAPSDVIQANGELRRILTCEAGCRSGKLDAAFTHDLPQGTQWKFRFSSPPKLFHSVYFGNTNSVEFAWNEIDGSKGQACRGLLFHSTAALDEYDLQIHDNDIHDTVCDCVSLSTVDPSRGKVSVFNNVLHACGTGSAQVTQSSYAAIYLANAPDCLPNPGRHGEVDVYQNTIYNAGSGGTPGYNTACFAFQAVADPKHGTASFNLTNNLCVQRGVNAQAYLIATGADNSGKPAAAFISGLDNDCFGLDKECPREFRQSFHADPKFVSTDSANFHLTPASPIFDTASSAGPSSNIDHDGRTRTSRSAPGAYERPTQ